MATSSFEHHNYPAVLRVLACAAEATPESINPERFCRAMDRITDKSYLAGQAIQEGMAGCLYRAMKSSTPADHFDSGPLHILKKAYYRAVQMNLQLEHGLVAVLEAAAQQQIRIVVLQGMALLVDLYPDVGMRPMTDIDLWVLDLPEFAEMLDSLGYAQDSMYPQTFRKGPVTFDVHTHLFWADRIKSRKWLLAVDPEEIFNAAEPFSIGGRPALRLNRYDQVGYLGLHLIKHRADRLIWLADVKLILERFSGSEWQEMAARVEHIGLARPLAHVLYLLDRLFEFHPPETCDGLFRRHSPGLFERWILRRRLVQKGIPGWASPILFASGMRPAGRMAFVRETLFPDPEVLRQSFPGDSRNPGWRFHVKRIAELAGIYR